MDLLRSVRADVRRRVQSSKEQRQHRLTTPQPAKVPNRDPKAWSRIEQTESPFWTLPPELRAHIISTAFGGRIVYIDLRLRPPLLDKSTSGRDPGHGGYPPLMEVSRSSKGFWLPRKYREVAWRWYHCVCHRHVAWGLELPLGYFLGDDCLKGEALCLGELTKSSYDACRLGIMGFMLSCKQR